MLHANYTGGNVSNFVSDIFRIALPSSQIFILLCDDSLLTNAKKKKRKKKRQPVQQAITIFNCFPKWKIDCISLPL